MKKIIFLTSLIFIYFLFSCTETVTVVSPEVIGDTTNVVLDTIPLTGDTTKTINESPLTKELKGIYKGARLETHFPKEPIPKIFFDSLIILQKGSISTFKIDSISLESLLDYKGISNSIDNDTLKYSKRISVYQGENLYIIRSKKSIWTFSQYNHNVGNGTLYYHGYYSLK